MLIKTLKSNPLEQVTELQHLIQRLKTSRIIIRTLSSIFLASTSLLPCLAAERVNINLGADWRFLREEATLATPVKDWAVVTVPHTWNAKDILPLPSTGKDSPKPTPYRGVGWYQRELNLNQAWRGQRIFIRFEAASLVAQVSLNGKLIGEHRGGFTAFCYEITDAVNWSGSNDLRVRVNNTRVWDVAPLGGDFNVQGGLYRPVQLIVTDPLCISPIDYASSGVYIQQKEVTDQSATISVRTVLSGRNAGKVQVTTALLDARGTVVAQTRDSVQMDATEHRAELRIAQPRLWQGRNDPYLYTCRVSLSVDGAASDQVVVPFGVRTVAITDAQGFLLNGKPYPIHGVSRHMDVEGKGWALNAEDHDRDFALMKEMGVTAVRLPHLPQSAYVHDLSDRTGLIVWVELPLINKSEPTPKFTSNLELQLTEMLCQLANHPSVAFWSLYNEIGDDFDRNALLLQRLKALIEKMDSSRLIVGASHKSNNPMHTVPDWNCFNRYPGWYSGKAGSLGNQVTKDSAEIGRRVAISEYGAGGNPAHHQEDETIKVADTKQIFHPEEYQAYSHEKNWASIKNHPRIWGSFIWNMFDFTVLNRNEGGFTGLNDKGLISYDRTLRKDVFFFYKANWNPEPMLHLCSKRFIKREAAAVQVKAYSNCGPVVLRVNGQLRGTATPDENRIVRWPNVALTTGENLIQIEAAGLKDEARWMWAPTHP